MTWPLVVSITLPGGTSHRLSDEPEADAFIAGLDKSRKIRSSKREELSDTKEPYVIGWRVDVSELTTTRTEEFSTQAMAMKAMRKLSRFTHAQVLRPSGDKFKERVRCKNCSDETHFSNCSSGRVSLGWCPRCYKMRSSFSDYTNEDLGNKGIVRKTPFDSSGKS